MSVALLVEL
jgi:hypothetical protein